MSIEHIRRALVQVEEAEYYLRLFEPVSREPSSLARFGVSHSWMVWRSAKAESLIEISNEIAIAADTIRGVIARNGDDAPCHCGVPGQLKEFLPRVLRWGPGRAKTWGEAEAKGLTGEWSSLRDRSQRLGVDLKKVLGFLGDFRSTPACPSPITFVTVSEEEAEELGPPGSENKKKRRGMKVDEADAAGKRLTATTRQKQEFFSLSERKQAKRVGCCLVTWQRTPCFLEAVALGWYKRRTSGGSLSGTASTRRVASLTPELEATIGEGERDEMLKKLVAEEDAQATVPETPERKQWDGLTPEDRRAELAQCEEDDANEPSPLWGRTFAKSRRSRPK